MENEILKAIVNNGAWAVIFVWLLFDTRKESKASEEINVLNYGANAAEGVYKEFQKATGIKVNEKTFDDMLATLCDKSTGSEQEKEVIEDLYFIKKEGNNSAHTSGAKLPATTALDCLQRAFEVSINYAFSKNPKKIKLLKLEFDTELLITGEKTK